MTGQADKLFDDGSPHSPLTASIFEAAKQLKEGDRGGARAILARAAIAGMDELDLGNLLHVLKERTGIPKGELARQLKKMAGTGGDRSSRSARRPLYPIYEAISQPRELADICDEIAQRIRSRLSCSEDDITAITLWAVATHGVCEGFSPGQEGEARPGPSIFPRLRVYSGAPGSGKTTLLETVSLVAARAISADSFTASALFRIIDAHQPTLFLDEADAWIKRNEDVRKIINSGHRRAGMVVVNTKESADDPNWEPTTFRTFAPIAIAGLGGLAGTIEDRSISIVMKKSANFSGDRFSERELFAWRDALGPHLTAHAEALASAMAKSVDRARLPPALSARAADNWEPLLRVAQLAGKDWLRRALEACWNASVISQKGRALTYPEHLLADLYAYRRSLVEARRVRRKEKPAIPAAPPAGVDDPRHLLSTSNFIEWLEKSPGYASPWAEMIRRDHEGRVVRGPSPHRIAKVMRSFGVDPTRLDVWSKDIKKAVPIRGYLVADLRPLWRVHRSRDPKR